MNRSDNLSPLGFSKVGMLAIAGAALALTGLTLFLLPALDSFDSKPIETIKYRPVNTVTPPPKDSTRPPVQSMAEPDKKEVPQKMAVSKPHLDVTAPPRAKPQLPIRMDYSIQAPMPDLALDFPVALEKDMLPSEIGAAMSTKEAALEGGKEVYESDEVECLPEATNRLQPLFPYRAKLRNVNGAVVVAFTVLENGTTADASVISAQPPGYFEEATLQAILKWRFKPGLNQGKPIKTRMKTTVEFKLLND